MSDQDDLRGIATACVELVATQFNRHLDWSVDSLDELDAVCVELLAGGPLNDQRMDLWWKLIGAYTGEVLIRTHGGEWIRHESSPGAPAVLVQGATAFPFGITQRILDGEPFKSLASFVRVLPTVLERGRQPG